MKLLSVALACVAEFFVSCSSNVFVIERTLLFRLVLLLELLLRGGGGGGLVAGVVGLSSISSLFSIGFFLVAAIGLLNGEDGCPGFLLVMLLALLLLLLPLPLEVLLNEVGLGGDCKPIRAILIASEAPMVLNQHNML